MASETPRAGSPTGAAEQRLREMNEAPLVSSIRQNELLEKAQEAEASLRKTEAELRARLDELARFNSAAVGRELRIIELKTKLNNVAREHGEPEQYRRPDEEPSRIRDTVRHPPSAEYVAAASGGKISPLNGVGPEDLRITQLEARCHKEGIQEVLSTDGCQVRVSPEVTTEYHVIARSKTCGGKVSSMVLVTPKTKMGMKISGNQILTPHGSVSM